MKKICISLIQTHLYWEDPLKNRVLFDHWLSQISPASELVILPEMFSTGFSMNTELTETLQGETVIWMQTWAKKLGIPICGSVMIQGEDSHFYNRFIWANPDGRLFTYSKRHLFRMAHEDHHYQMGKDLLVVTYKGFRIMPLICYDLRFPVWSRNLKHNPVDIQIYVANWPQRRAEAWSALLKARAIENQTYVVGVNRVGVDGTGVAYSGDSVIHNMKGETLFTAHQVACVYNHTFEYDELQLFRTQFPAYLDADEFELERNIIEVQAD